MRMPFSRRASAVNSSSDSASPSVARHAGRNSLIEQLESRIMLASVVSETWQDETAPQSLVVEFNADERGVLNGSRVTLDNVSTDTPVFGAAVAFSSDGKTATITWPNQHGSALTQPATHMQTTSDQTPRAISRRTTP